MSVLRPDLMMKCVVPVIMAGIIAVSVSPSSVQMDIVLIPLRFTDSSCRYSYLETASYYFVAFYSIIDILRRSELSNAPIYWFHPTWCRSRSVWRVSLLALLLALSVMLVSAVQLNNRDCSSAWYVISSISFYLTDFVIDSYSHFRRSVGSLW